jgi:uncharacterized protein YbjT (DUF2867 family)
VAYKGNVLVVGATTTTGQAYAQALLAAGYRVWAPVAPLIDPRPLQARGLRVVEVNVLDEDDVRHAVGEIVAVVIALGDGHSQLAGTEEIVTRTFVAAARREAAGRIVYSSVLHADPSSKVKAFREKGRLEVHVADSGLPFTVLRPSTFMEALVSDGFRQGVEKKGILQSPIAADAPVSYVAVADLAAFGVAAIEEPSLNSMVVDIGGPDAVTFEGLLPRLAGLLRRPLDYAQLPLKQARRLLGRDLADVVAHINERGYAVDMEPVLSATPLSLTRLDDFLAERWPCTDAEQAAVLEHRRRPCVGGLQTEELAA